MVAASPVLAQPKQIFSFERAQAKSFLQM